MAQARGGFDRVGEIQVHVTCVQFYPYKRLRSDVFCFRPFHRRDEAAWPFLRGEACEGRMNPRKSLLLVGLPRGFTSFTYDVVARATGLQRALASEGEVLNPDGASRAAALSGRPFHYRPERGDHPEVYPAARAILERFRNGYVIKDVVQPWLVLDYLKEHPDAYRVLYIRRDLNRVRFISPAGAGPL
jgi:hypothetical protein